MPGPRVHCSNSVGHVPEGNCGPDCIVVPAPGLDDLARLDQAEEPVLVETSSHGQWA